MAKILPIYKKDDESLFSNYRPISILPVISKVIEKVIYNQIYSFFSQHKLFNESQYGFRAEHSTEYATPELVDRIHSDLVNNEIPFSIFLDLSKAFDTINHSILLNKLSHYGIKGIPLTLIKSYLLNRQQYVQYNSTVSNYLTISTGVPQGSILEPLLFIIYINDLPHVSNLFKFIMYADDTTLVGRIKNFTINNQNNELNTIRDNINKELNQISEWLKLNKLSLNASKSKYMIFSKRNRVINNIDLKIDGTTIQQLNDFNLLGLTIDEHLQWKQHIEKTANKCSRTIGIINKLKHYLPTHIKLLLYQTLLNPHLNYCILVWGYRCARLIKIQKKALRIINLSGYNSHCDPLFKSFNILKLPDMLRLQELKLYYKFVHNKLPHYLQQLPFHLNHDIHSHNTRTRNDIHIRPALHEFAKRSIRHDIPRTVNDSPHIIKDKILTHSLQGFTNYTKAHYLQSYLSQCMEINCYICQLAH